MTTMERWYYLYLMRFNNVIESLDIFILSPLLVRTTKTKEVDKTIVTNKGYFQGLLRFVEVSNIFG